MQMEMYLQQNGVNDANDANDDDDDDLCTNSN